MSEQQVTRTSAKVSEVAWSDPAVMDARMRLWDLVQYLTLISDYASPAELLDVNRRVHFPRISHELDELLDGLGGSGASEA